MIFVLRDSRSKLDNTVLTPWNTGGKRQCFKMRNKRQVQACFFGYTVPERLDLRRVHLVVVSLELLAV
jgi:hypothetical protein